MAIDVDRNTGPLAECVADIYAAAVGAVRRRFPAETPTEVLMTAGALLSVVYARIAVEATKDELSDPAALEDLVLNHADNVRDTLASALIARQKGIIK